VAWIPPQFRSGRYPDGADIEDIVNQVNSLTTGWQDYTVTWGNDGTAPSIGNGTLSAEYRWPNESDLVHVRINLTAGTTTTFGTSLQHFSLPVTAAAADRLVGPVHIFDSGTIRRVACTYVRSTTTVYIISDSGTVSNLVPWTWATGDQIDIDLWYRPA
jgi:hypothetical protein